MNKGIFNDVNEKKEVQNMEQDELINTEVGDKEKPRLGPSKVTILGVTIKRKNKNDEVMKSPLVTFICNHPDAQESIQISQVKIQDGDKLKVVGMWVDIDGDDKFQKGSTVAAVLEFLKAKSLSDVTGKTMDAIDESKDSKYLCLKAY